MKRIAVVSPFPLFPDNGGNRVRALGMIRALQDEGHRISFILLPSRRMGDFDYKAHIAFFGNDFHLLERSFGAQILYYAKRVAYRAYRIATGCVHQISDVDEVYYAGFTSQIERIDKGNSFDAVIVQYVHFSKAFSGFSQALKFIDTHDSFSGQMSSQEEVRGFLRADHLIAIQEQEAELFSKQLSSESGNIPDISIVSHIIQSFRNVEPRSHSGAVFLGSDFEQNNLSLRWFVDEVLPRIRELLPSFQLYVLGSVGNRIEEQEGIIKCGYVEDVTDVLNDTPILVNPIVRGTGVKIKLLEAWGMGVPVVSTELGVKGIPAKFLSGTLVVSDGNAEAFAEAVTRLMSNHLFWHEKAQLNRNIRELWNQEQVSSLAELMSDH